MDALGISGDALDSRNWNILSSYTKSKCKKFNLKKNVVPFNAQGVNEHFWKIRMRKENKSERKKQIFDKKQNNAMKSLEATNSKGHKSCVA